MGLFDSVYVPCPHCGKDVEFQSKAEWMPCMNTYTLDDAPTRILIDVLNSPQHCMSCDGWMALTDPQYPPETQEPPRPHPTVSKVRAPDNPTTHFQGFQWWPDDAPFTMADIIGDDED